MAESDQHASVLRLTTGLKPTPTLSFDDIMCRARERLKLVVLGRPELGFMTEPGFDGRCCPDMRNGYIDVLAPVVMPEAKSMAASSGRGRPRDLLGILESDDETRTEAVNRTVSLLQRNAELVTLTGTILNTAADPQAALECIELAEGVDLEPARLFHRQAGEDVTTEIEGHQVFFSRQTVRVSVTEQNAGACRLLLAGAHKSFADYRAALEGPAADLFGTDFKKRPRQDVRFGMLRRWQRIVLEGARQLNLPIDGEARPALSTKTFKQQRLEVQKVQNWRNLLDAVVSVLQQAQATFKDEESC